MLIYAVMQTLCPWVIAEEEEEEEEGRDDNKVLLIRRRFSSLGALQSLSFLLTEALSEPVKARS